MIRWILRKLDVLFPRYHDFIRTIQTRCPICKTTKTSVINEKCSDCVMADAIAYCEGGD